MKVKNVFFRTDTYDEIEKIVSKKNSFTESEI